MAEFVLVPWSRLEPEQQRGMLEELASRDGTDYGEQELPLARKVLQLDRQLQNCALALVYDLESDSWELVPPERLAALGLSREDLRALADQSGDPDDRA